MSTRILEKRSHLAYDSLGVKLTGTLQVCDCCERSQAKAHEFIKKTNTRATKPEESFFVENTGPFPESLIGKSYWIGVLDYYSRYSWGFFTKKNQSCKRKRSFFI